MRVFGCHEVLKDVGPIYLRQIVYTREVGRTGVRYPIA